MSALFGDMAYAFRTFRTARVFAVTAVLTLALGIGGTTAIFTLMHAVMLKSLPVADPSRLYRIGDGDNCCVMGSPQGRWGFYSFPLFERIKAETPQFEALTAFQTFVGRMSVRRQGVSESPRPLRTMYATGSYFKTLGVDAFAGRVFTADDDRAAASPVAVMAYTAWQGIYGGDGSVVGSTLMIEGHAFTVAGIAPPGFFGETLRADPPDLWLPLQHEPLISGADTSLLRQPVSAWLRVIGRLRADATIDGMDARLTVFLHQWMRSEAGYPANFMPEIERKMSENVITVVPAGAGVGVMKEQYGRSLRILLVVCAMVLLIACANVANLLLARAVARRGQIAVRLALGASRKQIVVDALMESVLLAVAGAVVGLVIAIGAARLLLSLAFAGATTLPIDVTPSPLVLAFAVGLALITGVLFGAAPAWFATRTNPIEALRSTGRSTGDGASFTRTTLLVVQATLSVVLVAGSTMLGRSLGNLEGQDFGFDRSGRVLVAVGRPSANITGDRLTALYREVEARLTGITGVEGAGLALYNPLTNNWGEGVLVAGKPPAAPGADIGSSWDRVSTRYLQQLGVKLVRGRYFADSDNERSENVAVVNEAFVRRFFSSGEDPIDRHFGLNLPENVNTFRIVGIVGDARFAGFQLNRPARPMFFVPLAQTVKYPSPLMQRVETASHYVGGILLVTNMPPGTLEPLVARALADADPNMTVINVRTLEEQVARSFDQQRAVASLAGLFGVIALVLAGIGLYGVTAYTVARRRSEIGLRMALGADRGNVMGLVLGGTFKRVAVGLVLGAPLAVGAGYLLSAQLYGVSFWDPVALSVAAAALAGAAFIASVMPALSAAALAPMIALRTD
ncbi:MAG TPA: ABC transporter permease [Vicinamibacterales bacterium]|nr:ABC transporter permease [Vicinamibacterales bacterium]